MFRKGGEGRYDGISSALTQYKLIFYEDIAQLDIIIIISLVEQAAYGSLEEREAGISMCIPLALYKLNFNGGIVC